MSPGPDRGFFLVKENSQSLLIFEVCEVKDAV